jgi:hypothetical protein
VQRTMNEAGLRKLSALRANYYSVAGRACEHFFCPLLFSDEATRVCRGHIINEKFRGSDPAWTIQRADVDGFFGTHFEEPFLALQEHGRHDLVDILADPTLHRILEPKLMIAGKEVPHYYPNKEEVPPRFVSLEIARTDKPPVKLGLKLSPSEAFAKTGEQWEVVVERDLRLVALVSVLKAAHLTFFELMGYQYALSAGGHFLGHDILGRFFLANHGRSRRVIHNHARDHFREFVNLVRPILRAPAEITGTISDQWLYLCTGEPHPWAFLIFVRTGTDLHGVVVPILEDEVGALRFLEFLKNPARSIEVKLARLVEEHWEVAPNASCLNWPEPKFD